MQGPSLFHGWDELDAGCRIPGTITTGDAEQAVARWDDFAIWVATCRLGPDAGFEVRSAATETVAFLLDGELQHGSEQLPSGSAIVAEPGASYAAYATDHDARIVLFGSWTPSKGHRVGWRQPTVHVFGPTGAHARPATAEQPAYTRAFVDSTCDGCRAGLLRISCETSFTAASHVHSEDEIIVLLAGDMRVGPLVLQPGTAIAVPSGRRYGFTSAEGFDFVNFRPGPSTVVQRPGTPAIVETAEGLGLLPVCDPPD